VWTRCRAVGEEKGVVYVECSYLRAPWESAEVEVRGEVPGLDGNKLKLGLKGKVLLKGKEGERGKFGDKEFVFQVRAVGALGKVNGVVIIYILGKGEYRGKVYGQRVEGRSEGEATFPVFPVGGAKASLEVGGIYLEKELPHPDELSELDLDFPYSVVEVGEALKVKFEAPFYALDGERLEGERELPYGTVALYQGVPEPLRRFKSEKVGEIWLGSVERAFKVRGGAVVHTSRTTVIIKDGRVRDLGIKTSCYYDDNLYSIGDKAFVDGRRLELPSEPFSCVRFANKAIFSIPSRPVTSTLTLLSPTVIVAIGPSSVPWKVPWSAFEKAKLYVAEEDYEVELSQGAYALYAGERLYAYNLFGEALAFDRELRKVWRRDSNGVRDLDELGDKVAIKTFAPPRVRLYEGRKEVLKVHTSRTSSACLSDRALFVLDGNKLRLFLLDKGFYELVSKVEPGELCAASGDLIAVISKEKVSFWKPLIRFA